MRGNANKVVIELCFKISLQFFMMLIDRCWCFIVVSPEISYKLAHFMDFILHYFWFWFYMNKIWIWFAPFHVPSKLEKQYFRKCCLFFFLPPADWFLEISLEYVHKSIVLFYSSCGLNSTVNFEMKEMLLSFGNDQKNSENNLLKCHGTWRNNSKRRKRNYFIVFFYWCFCYWFNLLIYIRLQMFTISKPYIVINFNSLMLFTTILVRNRLSVSSRPIFWHYNYTFE